MRRAALLLAMSACGFNATVTGTDAGGDAPDAAEPDVMPDAPTAFWTAEIGVTANGNALTKTTAASTWGDAGAASSAQLGGNGYLEFTTAEASTGKALGLSHGNTDAHIKDIDFAILLSRAAQVEVYESNTKRGTFGTYAAGDVFRITVTAGVISYARNGTPFYTSAVAPTFPLLADAALYSPGATLEDVAIVAQ